MKYLLIHDAYVPWNAGIKENNTMSVAHLEVMDY